MEISASVFVCVFTVSFHQEHECHHFCGSRSFGGQVSWDETVCPGATYQETDETITHQVVDRPKLTTQNLSRLVDMPMLFGRWSHEVPMLFGRWSHEALSLKFVGGGDIPQMVECPIWHSVDTGSTTWCHKTFFSSGSVFSADSLSMFVQSMQLHAQSGGRVSAPMCCRCRFDSLVWEGIFLPKVSFQCRLPYFQCLYSPLCMHRVVLECPLQQAVGTGLTPWCEKAFSSLGWFLVVCFFVFF